MRRRQHHTHYRRQFYGKRSRSGAQYIGGLIKRTIRGVAANFGVSRWTVIAGFVLLFVFTHWFALLAFLLAYLWVKNPGKFEDVFDSVVEKSRHIFGSMSEATPRRQSSAAGRAGRAHAYEDHDFSELRRKFDDLETRANDMEAHVSSEEYRLSREIDDIK